MSKLSKKQENPKINKLKLLQFIEPIFEIIVQDIISSRIKNNNEKDNLLIRYNISNNKVIDLTNYGGDNDQVIEYNIYILFKRQSISFMVEHWKFKIDTSKSQELNDFYKNRIKKKLLTFYRSIKSMEILLPINSLVKKSLDFSFSAQLYQRSDIEISTEEKIKSEKKQINLETKDDKYGGIQLSINFLTNDGIFTHEENLKDFINEEKYINLCSKYSKPPQNLDNANKNIINNDNYNDIKNNNKEDDQEINESLMFEEADKNELMFSSIIQNKIIDKRGNLEKSDYEEIEEVKKGNSKEQINYEELYNSCFKNIEDINCKKTLDNILSRNNLMKNENIKLNDIKDKYELHFGKNNLLVEELYEENKNFEFNDLIINHPKKNKKKKIIISDYFYVKKHAKKEENENVKDLFNDIISDFIDIKQSFNQN